MRISSTIATLVVLSACGGTATTTKTMSFEQAQRFCYDQTIAAVDVRKGEVVKASIGADGGFRGGIFKGGFLRGNISGAPYNACMAEKTGDLALGNRIEVTDGVILTPEEKLSWDQLTPEERERVRLFIINGGTFASASESGT